METLNIPLSNTAIIQGDTIPEILFEFDTLDNIVESLVIYNNRAAALLAGRPLYSAYLKTEGVVYPTTAGWVRDIVLPS